MSGKIKVICHGCGARYQVLSDKVRGRRFRAICKKCGGIIVAHCTDAFTVMPGGSSRSGRPASALQLDREDLDQDDDCTWYAVIGGKPHGPMSQSQIRSSFERGQISERTYLWRAGDPEWRRFSEVADFASLVSFKQPTASFSEGQDSQETSETVAGGPEGIRRQSGIGGAQVYDAADDVGYDDPTAERTALHHDALPAEEMEGEATQYHLTDQEQHPPYGGQEPQVQAPPNQEAWQQVPVMPPRKAVLPSPSGTPMRPVLTSPSALSEGGPSDDHTRPLSQDERVEAAGLSTPTGPSNGLVAPALRSGSLPPLPQGPASTPSGMPLLTPALGPRTLAPVGGQPGQPGHLLAPVAGEEPFWTTGKVVAAAAIGGGLAVALAVVIVVSLVRPKQHTVVELSKTSIVAASQGEIKRTASEVEDKRAAQAEDKSEDKSEDTSEDKSEDTSEDVKISIKAREQPEPRKVALTKATPGKAEPPTPGKAAASRVKKRRPTHRRVVRPRRSKHRRRRASLGSQVDALLAARARSRKKASSAAADADSILAAGARPRKKASSAAADADAILAAGTRPRRRRSTTTTRSLSQAQIQAAMRRVMPHVRNCYDKYGQGGLVKVRVTLRSTGKATGVVVGKLASTPTGFCVLGGVYKATFPKFSGNPITFVYPFRLQ